MLYLVLKIIDDIMHGPRPAEPHPEREPDEHALGCRHQHRDDADPDRASGADRRRHGRRRLSRALVSAQLQCRAQRAARYPVRVRRQLGSVGDPDVSVDGRDRVQFRHRRRPVPRGLCLVRPIARRACGRDQLGLRRLRRGVRIEHRRGRGDGAARGAGNAQEQIRQGARDRRLRLGRHARCADPALDPVRDLWRVRRSLDREIAARRHPSGAAHRRRLHDHDRRALLAQSEARPAGRSSRAATRCGRSAGRRCATSGRSWC